MEEILKHMLSKHTTLNLHLSNRKKVDAIKRIEYSDRGFGFIQGYRNLDITATAGVPPKLAIAIETLILLLLQVFPKNLQ